MNNTLKTLLLILTTVSTNLSFGQGCSDAGFCTMNNLKPQEHDSTALFSNQIKASISIGKADHNIIVISNSLEYNRELNEKLSLDFKVTSLSQNGNGVSVVGLSDFLFAGNYKISESISLTLGGKIPLDNSVNTHKGIPLSLDYQSSLGSYDVIAGVGIMLNGLQIVSAVQAPLIQNNNTYVPFIKPELFEDFSAEMIFEDYTRSADVLLRFSYPLELGKKIILSPSLLPIYHLSNDKYTYLGSEQEIEGSKGLTFNVNAYFVYLVNNHHSIQFNVGAPLIVRDARPDGLTRNYIGTVEYRYRF